MRSLNDLESWIDFKSKVMLMYPNFFTLLSSNHPNLTLREIKLCALILMECDSNEAASLLDITPQGIYTSESKLRRKFSLIDGQKLHSYLLKFGAKEWMPEAFSGTQL